MFVSPSLLFRGLSFAIPLAAALAAGSATARAADDQRETARMGDALQVMADLTLIDGACRSLVVNLGVGFRFATAQGLPVTAIMPAGSKRAEFERVLQSRQDSFAPEELCGQVAGNYAEALPGSITGLMTRTAGKP